MNEYNIDHHKLALHPQRVAQWLEGKDIYPLYIEISPSAVCNHRCIFCAFDYLSRKPIFLKEISLRRFLRDITKKGVKSILFSGEGEPLLYKNFPEIVSYARKQGLDVALTTNALLLFKGLAKKIIPYLNWLRVSLNAATPKTYARVHRTAPSDFTKVIHNIKEAVAIKKMGRYPCTIGAQLLLLNENYKEAYKLADRLKNIGVDYLIIKPYSQHPLSRNRLKTSLNYRRLLYLEKRLNIYSDSKFQVIFRKNTMFKIDRPRPYKKCLGFPFYAHLAADGNLYSCNAFIGDRRFCYGNIYKSSFTEIWRGKKKRSIARMISVRWDVRRCREICRLDEINRYLWKLKNPPPHVNFI